MEFNKPYNREIFTQFLQYEFLPSDYTPCVKEIEFSVQPKYATSATLLGKSESLELVVYEIRHTSRHDARVSLSKEAFRILADEFAAKALVIFVPEDNCANYRFSLIEMTLDWKGSKITRNYSNPRRYSYYLGEGIAYYTPNKFLNAGKVTDDKDLHERFSVEVLTKQFYTELSNWYAWAIKEMRFPNKLDGSADDITYNNESAIRMITRLIFVWFLKQQGLIPNEFFDEEYLAKKLLKDFAPNAHQDGYLDIQPNIGKSKESKYYKAILQNLFFAMLNSPIIDENGNMMRRFSKESSGDYGNAKLMRYQKYFKDPQHFLDLANRTVPFLNGGLFDCLDDKDAKIFYDGFSDNEKIQKALFVPDYMFFGEDRKVDLSDYYGDGDYRQVSACGIIDILKRYNFTVEENTPFDKEVSLDPELLGKVFENLLAAYNPETKSTARKATGSFYTPREIVQYMVDESIIAHLKCTISDDLEPEFRKMLAYNDEQLNFTEKQRKDIITSLYNCKILDPACGSGAFPVGVLQQMVHILNRIDEDNAMWHEMMIDQAIEETSDAYRDADDAERKELIAEIERSFDESINRPDYARKLYLIENCIYGVDIQPIAIQISKLRFFISLVVDQKINSNSADNFGVRPLPNLEAKFVAANSLIGLSKEITLAETEIIRNYKKQLKAANHKIFSAKTITTKRKYKEILKETRVALAKELKKLGFIDESEVSMLASWDMFDQNSYSPFFDADWMFGINDGFDIVIGNPPYIDSETMTTSMPEMRKLYASKFQCASGNWDIYIIFYELGYNLLAASGRLSFITPNKWLSIGYAKKLRKNFYKNIDKICDCQKIKVFEAGNEPIICSLSKEPIDHITVTRFSEQKIPKVIQRVNKKIINEDNLGVCISDFIELILKIKSMPNIVKDFATVENPFSTAEAYDLIPLIKDNSNAPSSYKLINTGTIDPYICLWGKRKTRYLKNVYTFPSIDQSLFAKKFPRRVRQASSEKLIISGMRYFECFYDKKGEYVAGKSTIIVLNAICNDYLQELLALFNSKLITFYIRQSFSTLGIDGGINFTKDMVEMLPIPDLSACDLGTFTDKLIKNNHVAQEQIEKEIDKKVYHLYNLTYDEVLIVDPTTPISREEYE